MVNLRNEIDSIIETIEIMNDKELLKSIKQGESDIMMGKTTRFDSADKAKEWLKNELELLNYSDEFKKKLRKIDRGSKKIVLKRICKIIDYPYHGKPLSHDLSGRSV
ncbi:MAG: hypothetical protein CVT90_02815 [Candidatus Altiarchaeales archaeon HGW-Altiarchaeales-3]|nr:MAG: hypothetical protein CVT90_02815 [Candidatus Altiarchaeales archaeon HGW-Altiarchaeales-3]